MIIVMIIVLTISVLHADVHRKPKTATTPCLVSNTTANAGQEAGHVTRTTDLENQHFVTARSTRNVIMKTKLNVLEGRMQTTST